MRVSDAVDEYRYSIIEHSPHTQRWFLSRLSTFAAWCDAQQLTLESLKPVEVNRFINSLRGNVNPRTGKPISSYTLHGYARAIRAFLNWCSNEVGLEELVAPRIGKRIAMPRIEQKVIEILTPEQIRLMFAACDREFRTNLAVRDRAILSVLLDTGIRASELCGLTLDCCYLKPDEAYIKVLGKGSKWREVPLGKQARAALHRYITRYRKPRNNAEKHVFLTRFLQPLTTNGLDQLLYRLAEWSHLKGVRVSAHIWRHTFAVNYLVNGGDVYKLSRLLGHTGLTVTLNYVKAMKQREARQGGISVLDSLK